MVTRLSRRTILFAAVVLAGGATSAAAQSARGGLRHRRSGSGQADAAAPHERIPVGADDRQAYDLYRPDAAGPILAYVHGGGWAHGDRSMVHALPDFAERHGLVLASIGYRLVPEVTPREQARDVAAALADLVRRHPGRDLYLMGHSAGAHLAALVGVDPVYLAEHGLAPSDLAGVILLDGAGYDATGDRGNGFAGRILTRLYDEAFGDQAAALSPTLRIAPGVPLPPFLIFYIASRADSRAQSEGLARVLQQAGGSAEVIVAPGDSHREINVGFGQPGDPQGERAARFIAQARR
ncbi:alpha/beta hydrolase [Brevundimonas subvibrioides]